MILPISDKNAPYLLTIENKNAPYFITYKEQECTIFINYKEQELSSPLLACLCQKEILKTKQQTKKLSTNVIEM